MLVQFSLKNVKIGKHKEKTLDARPIPALRRQSWQSKETFDKVTLILLGFIALRILYLNL